MGEYRNSEDFSRSDPNDGITLGDLIDTSTDKNASEVSHLRQENNGLLEVCKSLSETVHHLIKERR